VYWRCSPGAAERAVAGLLSATSQRAKESDVEGAIAAAFDASWAARFAFGKSSPKLSAAVCTAAKVLRDTDSRGQAMAATLLERFVTLWHSFASPQDELDALDISVNGFELAGQTKKALWFAERMET